MRDSTGLETHARLRAAFAAEAETVSRYLYFAKIAEIEGYPEVAQLFRDLAEGGVCNAHGHLDFLKRFGDPRTALPIGETDRNLRAAISAEQQETLEDLPEMAATADADGFPDIANWFETMGRLKAVHVERLKEALARIENPGPRTAP